MHRLAPALALLATATLTACGASTSASAGNPPPASADTAAPTCSALFTPGRQVPAMTGQIDCTDPDGTTQYITTIRCSDGTHLGAVPGSSGAPEGWFLAPGPYQATADAVSDPAYRAAYEACTA